jgi:3-oxoacyl-[acyl-carrier-protein] synthase I
MKPPQRMPPVAVRAHTLACSAGLGVAALQQALEHNRAALEPNTPALGITHAPLPCWLGRIAAVDHTPLPAPLAAWDCRATRVAWLGLQADSFASAARAATARHGAARVGLVLGTSASTIGVSEGAYRALAPDGGFPPALRNPALNNLHAVTAFVAAALGIEGPAVTVSTACSSSAKAVAQGERWLRLGLVDAVVVGGVDALCQSTLHGFAALQLLSPEPCTPFGATRRGISIGEAAVFVLLERGSDAPLLLLGHGESNDAHHMSSPHPEGRGAERALDAALARAGLHADRIDFVQLHGTGTPQNDAVEAALVARRLPEQVHACASKGLTGHTMGAAGALGALVALQALASGVCAGSVPGTAADPALGERFAAAQWQPQPLRRTVRVAASHAFGFGGNNAVLLFGSAA